MYRNFEALHLNLIAWCLFSLLSTGLHVNYVLPTVLERQETSICWNSSQSDLGQQSRRPAVGPRHLLPQRQEVLCPRCDREKPHDSTTPGRHRSIRTQVNCSGFFQLILRWALTTFPSILRPLSWGRAGKLNISRVLFNILYSKGAILYKFLLIFLSS